MGLMDIFFSSEEDDTKTSEAAPTQEAVTDSAPVATASTAPVAASAPVATPTPTVISAGVNDEMAQMLMSAIEEANLEGFDYIEFRDTVNDLGNNGMTEANKFLSVFATASRMGLTRETLLSSIDHYLGVIGEKREAFMAMVESQLESEVQGRYDKAASLDEDIAKAQEEINRLNEVITNSQREKIQLQNEANTEKMNIENTRASFESTFGMVQGKLLTDKGNIETYIPSANATSTETKGE